MMVPSLLVILLLLLALLGTRAGRGYLSLRRHLLRGRLQPGVPIVYRMAESSTRLPGPEAHDVHPAERGDLYYYLIKKYWRVEQVLQDGRIVAVTPLMSTTACGGMIPTCAGPISSNGSGTGRAFRVSPNERSSRP